MKGSTLTEQTPPPQPQSSNYDIQTGCCWGSFVNCPFRSWTEHVLCPLSCNSQQTSACDLLPPHWSKVRWSNRTFLENEYLHKGHSKKLPSSYWKTAKSFNHRGISDMMTQWCDRLQQTNFTSVAFALQTEPMSLQNLRGPASDYTDGDFSFCDVV